MLLKGFFHLLRFTLQIFLAWAPDKLPPNTVKSFNENREHLYKYCIGISIQMFIKCRIEIFLSNHFLLSICICLSLSLSLSPYLGEHKTDSSINCSPACDHTITGVLKERIQLNNLLQVHETDNTLMSIIWSCLQQRFPYLFFFHSKVSAVMFQIHVILHKWPLVQ